MGSGREALPSWAGFRQRLQPNCARVTRSQAGGSAGEGGSDGEPSGLTSMARRQRGGEDGRAGSRALPVPGAGSGAAGEGAMPFPWPAPAPRDSLAAWPRGGRLSAGGDALPPVGPWRPHPISLGHPGLSAGAVHMGKGCEGRAGTCPMCPGAAAPPGHRQPRPPKGRRCSAPGCSRHGAGQCHQLPPPQTLVQGCVKAAPIAASAWGWNAGWG